MIRRILGRIGISDHELENRARWYVKIRWMYLVAFSLTGILTEYFVFGLNTRVLSDGLLMVAAFVANFLFYLSLRKEDRTSKSIKTIILFQIILDVFMSAYLIYAHGGTESRTIILYAIPIIVSGGLFGRHALIISTGLSLLSYNGILFLDDLGFISVVKNAETLAYDNLAIVALFYTSVLITIAVIADYIFDLTKRTEEELAKNEMIALASHQLRTPATAVKSLMSMLIDEYVGKLSQEQLAILKQAYEENDRQLKLVESMLNVAHIDSGSIEIERKKTNIGLLVSEVVTHVTPILKSRKQKIKMETPKTPVVHKVDKQRLQIVVENLLSNASKYTKKGGAIYVKIEKNTDGMIMHVSDSGVGIAKKDLTKLYQKYSRLSNIETTRITGSGLGLYLSKRIVDMHGGTIKVNSTLGKGSTFTVIIP